MDPALSLWIRIVRSFLIAALALVSQTSWGQDDNFLLQEQLTLNQDSITIDDLVSRLAFEQDVTLSYNSTLIEEEAWIKLDKNTYTIEELINLIFGSQQVILEQRGRKLTVIQEARKRTINGFIRDRETGESLSGALIYDPKNDRFNYSNESGYYSLEVTYDSEEIYISLLGYENRTIDLSTDDYHIIQLSYTNKFKPIVILQQVNSEFNVNDGSKLIDVSDDRFNRHIIHENDLIQAVQSELSIQSGNEGQASYVVQGADLDQNLVLIEGIPFYEYSHTLGLGTTFIKDALHSADMFTSGISARYGGRVSSVLDVTFKKGNLYEWKKNISLGLDKALVQIEGPIVKEKTSINAAVKQSLFNLYVPGLIDKYTDYNRNHINYRDALLNIRHKFSPTKELRAFLYFYQDDFGLGRENHRDNLLAENYSQLNWRQATQKISYGSVISNDLHFNMNLALSQFNYSSKSSYRFTSLLDGGTNINNLYTVSDINDFYLKFNMDYFVNDWHKLTFGSEFNAKTLSPGVVQNTEQYDGDLDTLSSERSSLPVKQYSLFIQDVIIPNQRLQLYLGMRYDRFTGRGNYDVFQPRVKLALLPYPSTRFTFSYDRTSQFLHQLVNNGLGLPSGFWFPSTEVLKPQQAHIFSTQLIQNIKNNLHFEITGFYKSFSGLKDFNNEQLLFLPDLNSNLPPYISDINDWEFLVSQGDGWSYGGGIKMRYETERLSTMIKYFYGRSFRKFANINDGETFRAKYDRPHDIMVAVNYDLNESFHIGTEFTYVSGTTFSLPLEGFNDVYGIQFLSSNGKNNYRMPSYHHLNIFASYSYKKPNYELRITAGLTNVYNRSNAYYLYLYSLPETERYVLRKVSLFPILPRLTTSLSF